VYACVRHKEANPRTGRRRLPSTPMPLGGSTYSYINHEYDYAFHDSSAKTNPPETGKEYEYAAGNTQQPTPPQPPPPPDVGYLQPLEMHATSGCGNPTTVITDNGYTYAENKFQQQPPAQPPAGAAKPANNTYEKLTDAHDGSRPVQPPYARISHDPDSFTRL